MGDWKSTESYRGKYLHLNEHFKLKGNIILYLNILQGTDMETIKKQMLALIRHLGSNVKDLVVLTLPQLVVMPPLEYDIILQRQLDFNQWLLDRHGKISVHL